MKQIVVLMAFMALVYSGCATIPITVSEQVTLDELKECKIDTTPQKVKDPTTAGLLNVLPGMGNLYLAVGSRGHPVQHVFGVLNFITWPLSIIWGVPQAVNDADVINMKYAAEYYNVNPKGIKVIEQCRVTTKADSVTTTTKTGNLTIQEKK